LDAQTAAWVGGATVPQAVNLQRRTLLTPQVTEALADRLAKSAVAFASAPELANYMTAVHSAVSYVQNADLLSQALGGLTDALLQRDPQQFVVQPTTIGALDQWLKPPGGPTFVPTAAPAVDSPVAPFSPLRAGFLRLDQIWVIDDFGQMLDILRNLGSAEVPGPDFLPVAINSFLPLRPRLLQPSRLRLQFLDGTNDELVVDLASEANPICGWLLANHLDNSLMVYDAAGTLQGELLLTPTQTLWLGSPERSTAETETQAPSFANRHLTALVSSLLPSGGSTGPLTDLLATMDAAAWATSPFGTDVDITDPLVGQLVAVVRMQLNLELRGLPVISQRWEGTLNEDTGGVLGMSFPVRVGADLEDDGLVGVQSDGDAHLHSPYGPSANGWVVNDSVNVSPQKPTPFTAFLHPRGNVHAFSGILPPLVAELPATWQQPDRAMEVTFRAGPLVLPGGSVQMPIPAVPTGGEWSFLSYSDPGTVATMRPIVAAKSTASLIGPPSQIQEGWLRLPLTRPSTELTYSLAPESLPVGARFLQSGVTLVLFAYNGSGEDVPCQQIELQLPVGSDGTALTAAPEVIRCSCDEDSGWAVSAGSTPGSFVAQPDPTRPTLAGGGSFSVKLDNIRVTGTQGSVTVTVEETITGAPSGSTNLVLVKVPQ
jgi:hypothetical protein